MKLRRGLTLLEVLIAVAILSLLAAACIPLVQSSLAVVQAESPGLRLDQLAEFADAVMSDPSAVGLDGFPSYVELAWPDHPERQAVVLTKLASPDEQARHAWVVFSCEGWHVARWVSVDEQADSEQSPGGSP